MTIVITGICADRLGHAVHDGEALAAPADAYVRSQSRRIPLDLEHHGEPIGEVVALERDLASGLWATAVSEVDELAELSGSIYYSPLIVGDERIELRGLALTATPASSAAKPVTIIRDSRRSQPRYDGSVRDPAAAWSSARRLPEPPRRQPHRDP